MTYSFPGFRWVRRFTGLVLVVALLLVSGVCVLATLAEMDVTVSGEGTVQPRKRSHIKPRQDGRVSKVHVAAGDSVRPGQLVVELDDTAPKSQLEKAERDLESNRLLQDVYQHNRKRDLALFESEKVQAKARMETASLQLEQVSREYRLFYEHSPALKHRERQPIEALLPIRIRQAVYAQSEAEVQAVTEKIENLREAKLELRRLKSQEKKLEQDRFLLRHRIDAMRVRSEVNGTVLTREVDQLVGNVVKKGEGILEVAELGAWEVRTRVGELDFPKVKVGQDVRVYLEALPYPEFEVYAGKVSRLPGKVDPESAGNPSAGYPVVVSLDASQITDGDRDYSLSYGMKATTKIVIERGSVFQVLWRKILRSVGRLGKPKVRLGKDGRA